MVAAGVPNAGGPREGSHSACARHAERRVGRRFVEQRLSIRIGVNSGPVVAGVIGHNKFNYDLWGDAVNMASAWSHTGKPARFR